jgi:hypothetical protein
MPIACMLGIHGWRHVLCYDRPVLGCVVYAAVFGSFLCVSRDVMQATFVTSLPAHFRHLQCSTAVAGRISSAGCLMCNHCGHNASNA